jgi:hypothetical protein
MAHLADALQDMRDALTQVSLLLHDIQFESDAARRREIAEFSCMFLEKVKPR